jgi:hypothetical protein
MGIRFTNTRTKRSTRAKDGKDLALMLRIESDRRTGLELAKRPPDKQAVAS